jgi:ribosome biogenesis GTPase
LSDPVAVVLAREGNSYRVLLDGVERTAILRGKAREGDRAVAGDMVRIDPNTMGEETLAIAGVEPRHSLLERRTPEGRGTRPVAANVDQVVVVTASADPDPVLQLIDRLLVVAEANHIPPVVVVNKTDLRAASAIEEHLRATGYLVMPASTRSGEGVDALAAQLLGRVSVLTGPSGAGKSSLLNAIEPGLGLRIGAISAKSHRGTHTTTTATMIPVIGGGFVVDTPGFSEVGVWNVKPQALAALYPEFASRADECRFGDCHHRREPGCAVLEAIAADEIPASRHESYLAILAELEAQPEAWE